VGAVGHGEGGGDGEPRPAEGLRPEVATLVEELRAGAESLRALPLDGVPPALGDPDWP
jgi:hypothetical protein